MTSDEASQADASYNLAQALLDLADALDFFEPPENSTSVAQSYRLEALHLLHNVLLRERRLLYDGVQEEARLASDWEPSNARSVTSDNVEPILVKEQHVPTVGSCIETTLLLVDAQTDFWAGRGSYPTLEERQSMDQLFQDARPLAKEPSLQALMLLSEIDGAVVLEQLRWEEQMDVKESTDALENLLSRLAYVPAVHNGDEPVKFEVDKANASADLQALIAMRKLRSGETGHSVDFQEVWSHLSHAITVLNRAIQLPISPLTMPLAKSSMLCDLSAYSLGRACLADLGFRPAQRSWDQLIANAEVYANRALAEGGWGWLCSVAVGTSSVGTAVSATPSQGGYVKEDLMEKALWTLYRSLLLARSSQTTSVASDTKLSTLLAKTAQMSVRGRRIDSTRMERYLRELEREQGPLSVPERDQWAFTAQHLTPQDSLPKSII